MNDVIDLMHAHATVREFTTEPIGADVLASLIGAGRAASTWKAGQSYSIVVCSPEAKRAIYDVVGLPSIRDCAELLIYVGDLTRARVAVESLGKPFYPEGIESVLIGAVDCALAAQNTLLAAESVGLGGVFLGYVRYFSEELAEILDLPELTFPAFGLALGHPATTPGVKPRLPHDAVVHYGQYRRRTDDELREIVTQTDAEMAAYFGDGPPVHGSEGWSVRLGWQWAEPQTPSSTALLTKHGLL
jgi:nitroreductase